MQNNFYAVTLYWHDGGCIYLGTFPSMSQKAAEEDALHLYMSKSKAHAKQIEWGGGFQVDAQLLGPMSEKFDTARAGLT